MTPCFMTGLIVYPFCSHQRLLFPSRELPQRTRTSNCTNSSKRPCPNSKSKCRWISVSWRCAICTALCPFIAFLCSSVLLGASLTPPDLLDGRRVSGCAKVLPQRVLRSAALETAQTQNGGPAVLRHRSICDASRVCSKQALWFFFLVLMI